MHPVDYEKAGQIYDHASALAEREENPGVLVESLAQVARCYSIRKLGSERRPWLERARRIATPEHPAGWSRYLLIRGVYEREAGKRDEATRTFKELYEFCMQTELSKRAIERVATQRPESVGPFHCMVDEQEL